MKFRQKNPSTLIVNSIEAWQHLLKNRIMKSGKSKILYSSWANWAEMLKSERREVGIPNERKPGKPPTKSQFWNKKMCWHWTLQQRRWETTEYFSETWFQPPHTPRKKCSKRPAWREGAAKDRGGAGRPAGPRKSTAVKRPREQILMATYIQYWCKSVQIV